MSSATFRPEVGDLVDVSRGSFRRSLTRRRFHVRLVLAVVTGVAIGTAIGWLDAGQLDLGMALLGGAAMLGWLVVLLTLFYLLVPRRSARLFRQQQSLRQDFTVSWDEFGLSQRWKDGALTTRWDDYFDWFENRTVFGFGLNEQLYHFVPKRALTPDQQTSLRHCAQAIERGSPRA